MKNNSFELEGFRAAVGLEWAQRVTRLQGTEEFVEFVGGIEVGFELAGGEFFAEVVEAAGEEIEGGREDFLIREDDVAPGGIGASGKTERIAEAGTGEGDGKTVFVEMVVEKTGKGDCRELWEMRGQADGVVVLLSSEPQRAGPDFFEDFSEGGHARVVLVGGGADKGVGVGAEEVSIGMGDAGEFPAGHGMAAEEERSIGCGIKFRGGFDDADFGAAGIGDERDEVAGRHGQAMRRPMAGAMMRSSAMS